ERPLSDPRPRQQVQRRFRRGLPERGHPDSEDAGASTAGERDRRALRSHRPLGVSGLAVDPQSPPPRARAPRLRQPLQPAEAASRAPPPTTGAQEGIRRRNRNRQNPTPQP